MKHFLNLIRESSIRIPHEKALSDYGEDCCYTYLEMKEEVERVAGWLTSMGVEAGDRVAICGRSSSHWGIAFLATAMMRGVVVSILPDFTAENIIYLVRHSGAKVLMAGPNVLSKINGEKIDDVKIVDMEHWCIRDGEQMNCQSREWMELDNIDDLVLINYTSGTTDKPKGVMITNRALSSNVNYSLKTIEVRHGDAIVSMLPLAHIFGVMFDFIYQLAGGAHIVFMKKMPTPSLLLKAFKEVKPYMILTVPLVIEKIIQNKVFPIINQPKMKMLWYTPTLKHIIRKRVKENIIQAFGGKLRFLIVGGAAMNPQVEKCLKQIRFPYTSGYGMTEAAPLICYENWWDYKQGSVGKVVERMEIRIDSDDKYRIPGEILVRGENLFTGYYNNEEATKASFDEYGWFHTGDLGIFDKEGNLYLKGRCKNMILGPSGQNIYPEEIETKLNLIDKVVESVVVERAGKLIALVYPDYNQLDEEKIKDEVRDWLLSVNRQLPNYSQLSKIELMEEEFEKTPKKSIKRFLYK